MYSIGHRVTSIPLVDTKMPQHRTTINGNGKKKSKQTAQEKYDSNSIISAPVSYLSLQLYIIVIWLLCVHFLDPCECVCACLRLMHGVPNEVCLFNSWSFTMPSECVCASFFSRLLLCVKGLNVVKYTKSCFCLFIYINISSFFFWFLFKLHARCICLPFFSKDFGSLCMQQLQWSLCEKGEVTRAETKFISINVFILVFWICSSLRSFYLHKTNQNPSE